MIFGAALSFIGVSTVVAEIPPGGTVLHLQSSRQAPQRILAAELAAIENGESAGGTSVSPFDPEIDRVADAISGKRGPNGLIKVAQSGTSRTGERSRERTFSAILDKQIRSRCHMGSCGWFAITASSVEANARDGVLYQVDSHWWSAEYPDLDYDAWMPLEDDGQDSSFVFCSLTRPATFARDGVNWSVSMLSPNDPEGVFGYNISAYIFYFAACHGTITDAGDVMNDLAKRLGYRTSATRVGQSEVSTPQEYIRNR